MAEPRNNVDEKEGLHELMNEEMQEGDYYQHMNEMVEGEVIIGQDGSDYYGEDQLIEHIEYDEQYPSLLPVKDKIPVLTLNLPDLLSKTIPFTSSEKMILCFNKRCQRQIAFNSHLYTIENYVSESNWNSWLCVNHPCPGAIRTSPDMRELRVRQDHYADCVSDEVQIRLRIHIYDLRLTTEFTDLSLEHLYLAFQKRLNEENPEVAQFFPDFAHLATTMEDHRENKIYRKRFEMQALRDKQKKMNMTPDEVIFTETNSGYVRFRRTKAFPPTVCSCGVQFVSSNYPSQDQFISHMYHVHQRAMTIERFEFKDTNIFEQYIREMNIYSKHKMKRMGIADEQMYYLCVHDDRLAKNGPGRATKQQEQHNHCPAFIRIQDWRHVSKKETSPVEIFYCLEHNHEAPPPINPRDDLVDYYTPEQFARDVEERKIRTAKLLEDSTLQRIKRPLEVRTFMPTGRLKPTFGTRALAPPLAAQIAAGNSQPYVDFFDEMPPSDLRKKQRIGQPIRTAFPKKDDASESSEQPPPVESEASSSSVISGPKLSASKISRITERANFKDIYVFNSVCKLEDHCVSLVQKLQTCQNAKIVIGYKEKLMEILRKASVDPALMENATEEDCEKSWVSRTGRGRPKRKLKEIGEEEDEEETANNLKAEAIAGEVEEPKQAESVEPSDVVEKEIPQDQMPLVAAEVEIVEEVLDRVAETETSVDQTPAVKRRRRSVVPDSPLPPQLHASSSEVSRSGRQRKVPAKLKE